MYKLISYPQFRNTPGVDFFDITIPHSNIRDLVCHSGAAISPNSAPDGAWQFYLHPHQVDNLLAISGGRTFYLVNFSWEFPLQIVRLETRAKILSIPSGTFHRSVSDPDGSIVLNQGIRDLKTTTDREFRVYNSSHIPRLRRLLATDQLSKLEYQVLNLPVTLA